MATLRFGSLTVDTAIDGYLDFDLDFFPNVPAEAWAPYRALLPGDRLRMPMTTFVVRGNGRTLLVDTGLGPRLGRFMGTTGELPDALAAAGIRNEDVDAVVFTHLHPDHVGWSCSEQDGAFRPAFPNARYIVNRIEWERWKDIDASYLKRSVFPLAQTGQLTLVEDGHEPAPGVRLIATPGHTAGHVSILVYDGGEGGVITGDAAHHPAEIEHPDWSPMADDDPDLSARSRAALIDRIEADGLLVLGGHFPPPHAGRVLRVEQRRVYQPVTG